MDVQLSTYRYSGPAPAGEGQTCLVALGLGARGQHGLQLLQRIVRESVRARTALFVGIRFLAVPQRGHARGLRLASAGASGAGDCRRIRATTPATSKGSACLAQEPRCSPVPGVDSF